MKSFRSYLSGCLWFLIFLIPQNSYAVYPYANGCPNAGNNNEADAWAFFKCNCTSYVASKLNGDNTNSQYFTNRFRGQAWGNAANWRNAATALGGLIVANPQRGDIAWFTEGHVAYVESVNGDGSINISEFNSPTGSFAYRERGTGYRGYNGRAIRADAYIRIAHNIAVNPPAQANNNPITRVSYNTTNATKRTLRVYVTNTEGTSKTFTIGAGGALVGGSPVSPTNQNIQVDAGRTGFFSFNINNPPNGFSPARISLSSYNPKTYTCRTRNCEEQVDAATGEIILAFDSTATDNYVTVQEQKPPVISASTPTSGNASSQTITTASTIDYNKWIANKKSNLCLDSYKGLTADQTKLIQYGCVTTSPNEYWGLQQLSDGTYNIINKNSKLCLGIASNSASDWANAVIANCNTSNSMKWELVPAGNDYYSIRNKNSGKCLDLKNGATTEQTEIIQFTCNAVDSMRWQLRSISTVTKGLDLDGYCRAVYGSSFKAIVTNPSSALSWTCSSGTTTRGMDLDNACKLQHGSNYKAAYGNAADPYSWYCEASSASTTTVSPQPVTPSKQVQSVVINGPAIVDANNCVSYSLLATYSDNSTQNVSGTWSDNNGVATIDNNGRFCSGNPTSAQSVALTAQTTISGKVYSTNKQVTVPFVASGIAYYDLKMSSDMNGSNTNNGVLNGAEIGTFVFTTKALSASMIGKPVVFTVDIPLQGAYVGQLTVFGSNTCEAYIQSDLTGRCTIRLDASSSLPTKSYSLNVTATYNNQRIAADSRSISIQSNKSLPDFWVGGGWGTGSDGATFAIGKPISGTLLVINNGLITDVAPKFQFKAKNLTTGQITVLHEGVVNALGGKLNQASTDYSFNYPTTVGDYEISLELNGDNKIIESNYANNKIVFKIKVASLFTLTLGNTANDRVQIMGIPNVGQRVVQCGNGYDTSCSVQYDVNTVVTLTATPKYGATFIGWSGDCANVGKSTTCKVTLNKAISTTALVQNTAAASVVQSVEINGFNRLKVNTGTDYTMVVTYGDGMRQTVSATWSLDKPYSIAKVDLQQPSNGTAFLQATNSGSPQSIVLTGQTTINGKAYTVKLPISVVM